MSNSWSGAYVENDRIAISTLPCRAYKVLRYLCSRADGRGTCYPGIATIAADCGGWSVDTVMNYLDVLEQSGYMIYLRRNARDPLTGRQLPNVYMVNPAYIYLAPEQVEESIDLWLKNGGEELSPIPARLESNQQQNQTQLTNTSNYLQKPTTTTTNGTENAGETGIGAPPIQQQAAEPPKPKNQEKQKNGTNGESQKQQAKPTAPNGAPPNQGSANYNGHYEKLTPHKQALDTRAEQLAERVRTECRMPISVARALILRHGADTVQLAADHPFVKDADNPGGALRYLVGVVAPGDQMTVQSGIDRLVGKYGDFFEGLS